MKGLLAALPLAFALAGCGALDPTLRADAPGASGRAPVIVEVEFVGNAGIGSATLRKQVEDHLYDLSRDPTREAAVYDAALELEEHYEAQGYPGSKVSYRYTRPADGSPWPERVRVEFRVQEAPRVFVAMTLVGNTVHTTDRLLQLWSRHRVGAFGLGKPVYVAAEVQAFAEELRAFYRAEARLDAVVAEPVVAIDAEAGLARVTLTIQEGHVHTIRDVEFDAVLRDALGSTLPRSPAGQPARAETLRTYRASLRSALRAKGHPNPRLQVEAEPVADAPYTFDLVVRGEPGAVATIATIAVEGNVRTADGVILGRVSVKPGERYDGTKLDESLRRLHASGLFRKAEIVERRRADDPTLLDLTVRVEESDSRAVELLGGYGSYEQLRGGLRLEDRNLFGSGRSGAIESKLSMKGFATGVTLTDPDFLFTRSTLTLGGEYFRREEPVFTDEAIGGTLALARNLVDTLSARVGYTYRTRTDPSAFTTLPEDQFVDFVEGKVFVELRNDRRDNLLFPKSGHAEFLAFERIAPAYGANVDLDRLSFRASVHFGFLGPSRLVLRTEQNLVWPHEGSSRVPLQERWFSGGDTTVRSFREAQLGPKDDAGLPIGGEYRNLFGVEVRVPLWDTLEGGVFTDVGNVGRQVQDFSLRDLGYGIGAGLRVLLPIGPVRFDAAWNPDRAPGDPAWGYHLSVGYAF